MKKKGLESDGRGFSEGSLWNLTAAWFGKALFDTLRPISSR